MQNNYPNPLDNFRSHSYHFTLTVANTTEALRKMIEQAGNGGSSFLQSINSAPLGGKVDLDGDAAYLLIDTRRFSQYSITNFDMNHVYGTGDVANPSKVLAGAKMRLVDSTGLTFMNFLMDIMRTKIQSTKASAFFMLSISFHGHNDDNPQQTEIVSTCFIPMIMIGLHFEFANTGSIFDMEFAEVEGNPGNALPQLIDLGDIQAVSTEKTSNTLGGMCQSLEDRLNVRSMQFYQKFNNEAYARATDEQKKSFDRAGKLVQYMITVPQEWQNFAINSAGKSHNVEQQFLATAKKTDTTPASDKTGKELEKQSAPADKASYHSFSYTTDVTMAIKIMLESCKEYLDLGSEENRKAGKAVVHRTVITVTSDANTYMIHIDIYPYAVPKVLTPEEQKKKADLASKNKNTLSNGDVKNLISYDYLFSGKNSHVLDLKVDFSPASVAALDMDLSMGQSRFANNASTGQKEAKVQETGQSKTKDDNPMIRPGEPIFAPMKTKEQQTNFSGMATEEFNKDDANSLIKAKQEHTSTMAYLHFVAAMQTQITVRGNPNIIRKYADRNIRGGVPRHPKTISSPDALRSLRSDDTKAAETTYNKEIRSRLISEKAQYISSYVRPRIDDDKTKAGGDDALLHGGDVSTNAVYMIVNIYAPNVDYMGNQNEGDMFTNKFFYDGIYMILQVHTEFNNGSFRHTMNAIPYDLDGSFSKSSQVIS